MFVCGLQEFWCVLHAADVIVHVVAACFQLMSPLLFFPLTTEYQFLPLSDLQFPPPVTYASHYFSQKIMSSADYFPYSSHSLSTKPH